MAAQSQRPCYKLREPSSREAHVRVCPPGGARLGQAVRLDVNTVSHFVPHVVVAQLLVVLTVGLGAAHLHGDVLSLLHE